MRFVSTEKHTYWWPIKVEMPQPDRSGQWETHSFEMQFIQQNKDEAKRIADEFAALETVEEREQHQHELLLAAALDWRGVVGADNKPVPFSRDLLNEMLNAGPWFSTGIYKSWTRSLIKDDARLGN